ncbi:formate dehydrogenase accessory sulfurtransferase FdhD [Asticcacaulis sp. EMRT-3]|uniref:formate dehydrogenase accessory sulfurtransferase FdhD n=1 Tax=Asticcacaulis sp. EMRT-3 TaxID=3040349 RepID=UPI0024AFBAE1|nr:formate dehydrogenase accessory sulfurtransferase FdhD [Asticcacaulis sp. EMRT-3]MDI7776376.1 formate dehydrogenase accessory sulfurtransferase FdhD [Asticcacaulis sp. EMRT-3]
MTTAKPDALLPSPVLQASEQVWRRGAFVSGQRAIAEEVAVALVYDASTEAVMMATPADLEDFAVGFSLTEGIVSSCADIQRVEIVARDAGIEARLWLQAGLGERLATRRRARIGPSGCGLCGIDSLEAVTQASGGRANIRGGLSLRADEITDAIDQIRHHQIFGRETHAVHAAGYWVPGEGYLAVREDVGRHNALDKLAGALFRRETPPAPGAVVLTSRVSYEMVQKTIAIGASVLIAISAPTGMALRLAEAAGLTVVAVARADGFEVFTHPQRIGV